MKDLVTVKLRKERIAKWNYDAEVEAVRGLITRFQNVTVELLSRLWAAREELSRVGRPAQVGVGKTGTVVPVSWGAFCEAVGLEKRTVNRWLERYDPQERKKIERAPRARRAVEEGEMRGVAEVEVEPRPVQTPGYREEPGNRIEPGPPVARMRGKERPREKTLLATYQQILKPVGAQIAWAVKALEKMNNHATPTSILHFTKNMQKMQEMVESWSASKLKECPHCKGEGCRWCFGGKLGFYKELKG